MFESVWTQRSLRTIVLACGLLVFSSHWACAGLIASYGFDNDAQDSSGNGNHATLVGGIGFTADGGGFTGNAGDYALNVAAANQLVSAPAAAFQSMSTNNSATVSLWAYGVSQPRNDTIFSFTQGDTRQFQSHLPWGDGTLYFDTGGCCGGNTRVTTNTTPAEEGGQWNHFLFIKDGNDKSLWINGGLRINQVGGATAPINAFNEAVIGAQRLSGSNMNNYRGMVDDFGVWDIGLGPGEAQAVYNLAVEPDLQYGVAESDLLFELFDAGSGEADIDGTTWLNASGLTGSLGEVQNHGNGSYSLILDGNGNGVIGAPTAVPEPSTFALAALGLLGIGWFIRRKR